MAQIGLAVHDGHLPVAADEVIDELFALFYRVSDTAPPQNAVRERQNRKRHRPRLSTVLGRSPDM
jgi:hypothetical protein